MQNTGTDSYKLRKSRKRNGRVLSIASANPAGRGFSIESDLKEVFPHEESFMLKDSNQRYSAFET